MRLLRNGLIFLALNSLAAHAIAGLNGMSSKAEAIFAEVCATVQNKAIPGVNLDPNAEVSPGEDCETLYYAPGRVPNYKAAYRCAVHENNRLVLMMLYANGYGVPRDLSAALKIACISTDGAPAEILGRATHLATMLADGSEEEFDECTDITSGLAQGHCAAIQESFHSVTRNRRRAAITKTWTPADKAELLVLEHAKKSYIKQHAFAEVDMTGTARGVSIVFEREAQEDSFLDTLDLLAKRKFPRASARELEQVDRALNAAYYVTQHAKPSTTELEWGTVTPADIRETERTWIAYRDAWVTFATKRYPDVSATSVQAYLTRERLRILKGFVDPLQ